MVLSTETFNQSVRTEYSEAVNARYTFQPLWVSGCTRLARFTQHCCIRACALGPLVARQGPGAHKHRHVALKMLTMLRAFGHSVQHMPQHHVARCCVEILGAFGQAFSSKKRKLYISNPFSLWQRCELTKVGVMCRTGATDDKFSIFSLDIHTVFTCFIPGILIHTFHAVRIELNREIVTRTGNNVFRQRSRSRVVVLLA